MHTQCPHCGTMFNVSAEQLREARGMARCGRCMHSFDALERLNEGPLLDGPSVEKAEPVELTQHVSRSRWTLAEPPGEVESEQPFPAGTWDEPLEPSLHETHFLRDIVPGLATRSSGFEPEREEAPEPLEIGVEFDPNFDPPLEEPERSLEDLKGAADDEQTESTERPEPVAESPVPEVLREDMRRLETMALRARSRLLFGALSLALLVVLGFQYAWFMPEDMLRRYPQARGLLQSLCAHTGCELPTRRDPAKVQVLSRDVRVHPKYEGALLITASLVNAARYPQPYPTMQFSLFNVNGQTIATRLFEPEEYLPEGTDVEAGMAPQAPTLVELDVLAPEEAAVSFEFRFL